MRSVLYLTRSSGKKGMDSERLSDDVDEDNVNSGARREAVMGVKTAFVKAVGHYSGSSFGFLPSFSGLSGLGL